MEMLFGANSDAEARGDLPTTEYEKCRELSSGFRDATPVDNALYAF